MKDKTLKLHLGCGPKFIEGWLHYDALPYKHVDVVGPVEKLSLDDNTIDLIYASHLLEHFSRHEVKNVLNEWRRVLKPGGILRLAVPNFNAACSLYMSGEYKLEKILGLVCGGQKDQYDYHYNIFDHDSLSELLSKVGFHQIEEWNWRNTEHGHIDDYSQAYLPHMDKLHGRLVSLNLQAVK